MKDRIYPQNSIGPFLIPVSLSILPRFVKICSVLFSVVLPTNKQNNQPTNGQGWWRWVQERTFFSTDLEKGGES